MNILGARLKNSKLKDEILNPENYRETPGYQIADFNYNNKRLVVVATYQSASGTGKKAIAELKNQAASIANGEEFEIKAYPYQIAYNALPHIGSFKENGYTSEEMKMLDETRKILGDDNTRVAATTVRIPVYRAHSEVVHIETKKKISLQRTREILSAFPGIKVIDNPENLEYPLPLFAERKDEVFVGRIREDISTENGLVM